MNTGIYTSWKEGHYKFQKIKLGRLIKSLERLYEVELRFENDKLKNLTYSGSFFKDEPINIVLNMVEMSSKEVEVNKLDNKQFLITQKTQ